MLILLDIDGVMVPASNWKRPELLDDGFPNFSSRAVNGLNKMLQESGASILLTTSHRDSYTTAAWEEIFGKRGIDTTISKLTVPGKFETRKEEVLHWIEMQDGSVPFVIIDDDKSLNDLPAAFKKKLILTSPLVGLNDDLANQAVDILQQSAPASSQISLGATNTVVPVSFD